MKLRFIYTDMRGLLIQNKRIIELLNSCEITEDRMVQLLGKERIMKHGFASCFLDSLASQTEFFKNRI